MGSPVPTAPATAAGDTLHRAWADALKQFRLELSSDDYSKLHEVQSVDTLLEELSSLNATYMKRKVPRVIAKLDHFFKQLQLFTQSISIFVQSQPEISALVWGSLHILLQLALRHKEHLETIIDILEHVERHLPRIKSFADIFVVSNRIEKAVCGLYRDLIHFFSQATVFLRRNPIINILGINLPWAKRQRFREQFNRSLESIKAHTQWIDVESNVGLHIVAQQLTSQGHQDILSKISTMSSPPAIRLEPPTTTSYRIIPHVENPSFFGREAELKQMEDTLVPERERRLNVFSIVGEGGVGKSQLALQFAYRHFSEFNAIFWVSADNELKIAQGFEEIAIEVALVQGASNQESLGMVREATKRWLRNNAHTWLLILDNVESLSSLDDYWPTAAHGSIIITTRNQNLIQPPISSSTVLRSFSSKDGTEFILENILDESKTVDETDDANALQISKACGGLPLALSQVVRFIRSFNIPLSDAAMRFSTTEAFVAVRSELNQFNQPDYYHHEGVPVIWDRTLRSLSPACTTMVQLLSHLDPDGITEDLLKSSLKKTMQDRLGIDGDMNTHMMALLDRSLISRGSKSKNFSMHNLIQATILRSMDPTQRADLFVLVLDIIDNFFPGYEDSDLLVNSWAGCKLALPHVLRLLDLFSSTLLQDIPAYVKLGELFERASWYLQERGARKQAVGLLNHAMEIAQRGLQKYPEVVSDSESTRTSATRSSTSVAIQDLKELVCAITNSIGLLELGRSRFDKALNHFLEAVSMREGMGLIDRETIYMKRHVGIAYLSANRVDEGYAAFQHSLSLLEGQLTTSTDRNKLRDDLAFNYGSLSFALLDMGKLDEAWDAATKSTELLKQGHDKGSAMMGDCFTTLGNIRRLQGKLGDAEAFYLQALEIRTNVCGQHEETALSLHNYARILKQQGKDGDAIIIAKKGVEMLRELPDSKFILARSLFYLSQYEGPSEMNQSNQSYENEAVEIYCEHLGVARDKASFTNKDFDNLLVHYYR